LLGLAVAFPSLCFIPCGVEADDTATQGIPFFMPQVQLRRQFSQKPAQPEPVHSPRPVASTSVGQAILDSSRFDAELHSRVVRSGEFYLTRAAPPSDSGVVRFVDDIFTPEILHLGKTSVACPLATVIKKKNPLCLLSGFGTADGQICFKLLEIWW